MSTGTRRRTKKLAHSLSEATQLCMEHANRKHNRTAKRIADLMGVQLPTLYKYLAEDRMPVNLVGSFENACGVTYVTEYMCAQAHLLAVEMPTGRKLTQTDVMELQKNFAVATGLLIGFHEDGAAVEETSAALTTLMGEIGWHRANVERSTQPQLPFLNGDE